jgi:hypothetical protein
MPDPQPNPAEPSPSSPNAALRDPPPLETQVSAPEPNLPETPIPEPAPMLDVHPAHHAAQTWRDFFIHIATIVLGLLIAVGLEQTVEYIHHRRELTTAREELRVEVEQDSAIADRNTKAIHELQAKLNADMALLLAHRATGKPLTGKLDLTWTFTKTYYAALKSNQLSGALTLMPSAELEFYDFNSAVQEAIMTQAADWNGTIEVAKAIAARSPDGQLSPQDTNELISAISQAQGKLAYTETLIGFFNAGRKGQRGPTP